MSAANKDLLSSFGGMSLNSDVDDYDQVKAMARFQLLERYVLLVESCCCYCFR